ncbi:hypothetical protein RJ639_035935 [Escallonia herrerae]|uniref:Myb/SANT-like domain-containing protein n=1 Tax=Escallonia herrerae TaxID=1293975 RepID=A0AA88WX84_9ASTE|nr:hypothetical protein RJ639_035935 [Escallonia herrerae]
MEEVLCREGLREDICKLIEGIYKNELKDTTSEMCMSNMAINLNVFCPSMKTSLIWSGGTGKELNLVTERILFDVQISSRSLSSGYKENHLMHGICKGGLLRTMTYCSLSLAKVMLLEAIQELLERVDAIIASPIRCWTTMKAQGKSMRWTCKMDHCLSMILVEQVKLGNKGGLDNEFEPAVCAVVVSTLIERFQLEVTKDQVKNRIKTWEKLYGKVKELLEHNEFIWDKKQKMVVTTDSIWHDYFKVTRLEKNFGCVEYTTALDALNVELSPDFTRENIRSHLNTWKKLFGLVKELLCNSGFTWDESQKMVVANDATWNEYIKENTAVSTQGSKQTRARPFSSSLSRQPCKKRRGNDIVEDMMWAMATNIGRIADALTGRNELVRLDEEFEIVKKIPGFDDDLIIEACEFLSLDERRAKMFLKLDDSLDIVDIVGSFGSILYILVDSAPGGRTSKENWESRSNPSLEIVRLPISPGGICLELITRIRSQRRGELTNKPLHHEWGERAEKEAEQVGAEARIAGWSSKQQSLTLSVKLLDRCEQREP